MIDSCTVNVGSKSLETDSSATGHWKQDCTQRPEQVFKVPTAGKIAAFVVSLLAAPATAVDDIWYLEHKYRAAVTTVQIFEETMGRRISRIEALLIVRRILEKAEYERFQIAQLEAMKGLNWGDDE